MRGRTRLPGFRTPADTAAIKATALNYVEGWYEGSSERMAKSLHPDLFEADRANECAGV